MRFNFSTAKRGRCLVEVRSELGGPAATIWYFDRQGEPGTSYATSAEMKARFGNVLTTSQIERIARMAIDRFEAFGDFPGQTDRFIEGAEWRGELVPLA